MEMAVLQYDRKPFTLFRQFTLQQQHWLDVALGKSEFCFKALSLSVPADEPSTRTPSKKNK